MIQLSFVGNGNISPCPWSDKCLNHPCGCSGYSYWCGRFENEKQRKEMEKALRTFRELKEKTT